jgi:hypothetical protein
MVVPEAAQAGEGTLGRHDGGPTLGCDVVFYVARSLSSVAKARPVLAALSTSPKHLGKKQIKAETEVRAVK